jgi:mRNA interferase RelE/StbE
VESYSVWIRSSAEREIEALPDQVRRRVVERLIGLASEPRPAGAKKLSGRAEYRLRQGDHRMVYVVDDARREVVVVRVAHRSDVYR